MAKLSSDKPLFDEVVGEDQTLFLVEKILQEIDKKKLSSNLARPKIFLEGPLGSGKTALVRVFLKKLNPNAKFLGSPTYPIVNIYNLERHKTVHTDLYRIESFSEIISRGLWDEIVEDSTFTFIEWGFKFEEMREFFRKAENALLIQIKLDPKNGKVRRYQVTWS